MPEVEKILRMRTVLERTGLSRSTIYRKMKDGTFPRQVKISEHCSGWRASEIDRWITDPQSYSRGVQPGTVQPELREYSLPAPHPRRTS